MGNVELRLIGKLSERQAAQPPIGELLLRKGKIDQQDLQHALRLQSHIDAPLGSIMTAEGLVEKADVLDALAAQARTKTADLARSPPAHEIASSLPVALCMRHGVVPWRAEAGKLLVATSSPLGFRQFQQELGQAFGALTPIIVDETQIRAQQNRLYGPQLAREAAERVPEPLSCRNWGLNSTPRKMKAAVVLAALLLLTALAPLWMLTAVTLWALFTLLLTTALKAAALASHLAEKMPRGAFTRRFAFRRKRKTPGLDAPSSDLVLLSDARAEAALSLTEAARSFGRALPSVNAQDTPLRMPRVSVLVPLLREREIATQLIDRLSRLTYPKSLLEVVLVLEENDGVTRDTIARTPLPDWMSVIEVPHAGDLTTKPRALNYALNFCSGSIIGVWDAEDWPEADQIEKVVSRFHAAPEDVVCLQGVLDYYNSRSNWLARCFTIEYAVWWRIVMPGLARLGLVVPLGGTTLFFKRDVLTELGGWDAHNVTEDADLGVRLARRGYKTELLATVTREEATSRAWPWVRQRSRWLKGFLVTYLVHMRTPGALLADLGLWRFFGVQALFLAAFCQFALAPFLWVFWLTFAGVVHPVSQTLGMPFVLSLTYVFVACELVNLTLGWVAVSGREHRHLLAYVPTTMVYFTLGTLAAFKALAELIYRPFFWDKTQHGVTAQTDPVPRAVTPLPRQVSS